LLDNFNQIKLYRVGRGTAGFAERSTLEPALCPHCEMTTHSLPTGAWYSPVYFFRELLLKLVLVLLNTAPTPPAILYTSINHLKPRSVECEARRTSTGIRRRTTRITISIRGE